MQLSCFRLSSTSMAAVTLAAIGLNALIYNASAQSSNVRRSVLANQQLSFEPNLGQTGSDVEYLARAANYTAFLKRNEVTFRLGSIHSAAEARQLPATPPLGESTIVEMTLSGANSRTPPIAQAELSGRSNYFIGSGDKRHQIGVPHYAGVSYKAVYERIDVRYHGTQQGLEYDFIVAPGGDPGQINMSFNRDAHPEVSSDGNVMITANEKHLLLKKPVAYQLKAGIMSHVGSKYVSRGQQQIGIELGDYDPTQELIIDPTVVYSSYLGGTDDEGIFGIAFDHEGNIYVSGETSSIDFPTRDPLQSSVGGSYDAFVSKFDRTGTRLIYSTYLGGSAYDHAVAIAVDDEGQAYIAGITQSADFPTRHALQTALKGSLNAFVAKLDRSGSKLLFSTYLGGSGYEQPGGLAIDREGNVYVVGGTSSIDFPTTEHAFQRQCGGSALSHVCIDNGFATKIDRSGSKLLYSTYLGGSAYDLATAVAIDEEGAAYIVGQAGSHDFPLKNAFQASLAGFANAFLTKLDPSGNKLCFSTYLGGSSYDSGDGVAIDVRHDIYVTGFTGSANFPTLHSFQSAQAGQLDAFVTKFDSEGSKLLYSTFLGGSGTDFPFKIVVDGAGYASVAGFTDSTNFPLKDAIHPAYLGGNSDVFVSRLTPDGAALSFSTYLGGAGDDYGYALAKTLTGALWIGGSTSSTDLAVTDAYQAKYAGGPYDAFLTEVLLDRRDALKVLRSEIGNMVLTQRISQREAIRLEAILTVAIGQTDSGDEAELRESLRSFADRIEDDRDRHIISKWTASDLRLAANEFLSRGPN